MPLRILVRHAESTYNVEGRINGDPAIPVPLLSEPFLDDIHAGDLEGESREAYAAWIISHGRDSPFPGGESLDGAGARFASGMRSLADRPEEVVLAV